MKRLVVLFIALSGFSATAETLSFDLPGGWKEQTSSSGVRIWTHGPEILTLVPHSFSLPRAFGDLPEQKMKAAIEKSRGENLATVGIMEWKITSFKVLHLPGAGNLLLKIQGTCRGPISKTMKFEEWEYILGKEIYSIAYNTGGTFDDQHAATLLDKFAWPGRDVANTPEQNK